MDKKRAEEILDRFLDNEHVHDRWWDWMEFAQDEYDDLSSAASDVPMGLSDVIKAAYTPVSAPVYMALFYHVWGTSLFEGDDLEVYQVLGLLHDKNLHNLYVQCEAVMMDKLDVYDRARSKFGYQGMCQMSAPEQLHDLEKYPKGLLFGWEFTLYGYDDMRESDSYDYRQKRYVFAVYELK